MCSLISSFASNSWLKNLLRCLAMQYSCSAKQYIFKKKEVSKTLSVFLTHSDDFSLCKCIPKKKKLEQQFTIPQLTKYERILSILAWLILFWFLAAVLQTASKNAIFVHFLARKSQILGKSVKKVWKLLKLLNSLQ